MEDYRRNFMSRINQQSGVFLNGLTTECWEWRGCIDSLGYGSIATNYAKEYGTIKAHRISYWLFCGDYDKNLDVLHHCDNRKCVNPEHLHLGTQKDNNQERDERGRMTILRGENHGSSKFTQSEVDAILQLRREGMLYKDIAERYNVNRRTIERMCIGRTYDKTDTRETIQQQKQSRDNRIRELRAEGKTYAEISTEVGISPSKISVLLNK